MHRQVIIYLMVSVLIFFPLIKHSLLNWFGQNKYKATERCIRSNCSFNCQTHKSIHLKSHFPSSWKCSKIISLFKSGDKANPNNYRPISVLPTSSKLMEKAVYTQLYDYLTENNILNDNQFGFRRKCSTASTTSAYWPESHL